MKAKLICECRRIVRDYNKKTRKRSMRIVTVPAGTEIKNHRAYLLCLQGMAVPADAECREKVGMTDEQIYAAAGAYELISKGIAAEDRDAFKAGLMCGYKPDGEPGDTWKPGKNWTAGCEADYYSELEDEDDDDD